jgi:hypothetical protein
VGGGLGGVAVVDGPRVDEELHPMGNMLGSSVSERLRSKDGSRGRRRLASGGIQCESPMASLEDRR